MATQILNQKAVGETLTIEFDMLSRLKNQETVETAIVSYSVASGDAAATLAIVGPPIVANNIVSQAISGGVAGVIYKLTCAVRTSLNNILINEANLSVRSDNSLVPPVA